jgi:hypothetical protein
MTSSTDDETGAESTRHRSHEHRISRWRRRHEELDDEVAELDPADVAALLQRAAQAEQEPESVAQERLERAEVDDPAIRRVISDALKIGLADPSPGDDRRRLLPRRRSEGDRPAVPSPDEGEALRPGPDPVDLETRLRAAEARAEEYAAELRQARQEVTAAEQRAAEERVRLEQVVADQARILDEARAEQSRAQQLSEQRAEQLRRLRAELEQAEERSRALAAETAARATEHSERVRALVEEREAAEARVAAFERQLDEGHVLPTLAAVAPEPEPEPEVVEPPVEQEQEPAPQPEPVHSPTPAQAAATPYDVKRGAGPLGPSAGVVALGCAAAVGWMAYQATVLAHLIPSLVLTVIALLGLTIALRQRSKSSEVHLDNGTMRLRHGDRHHTFYLTSRSTQLEMTGRPGDRDWKVQVLRRGMEPVTINHKDVDPVAFTEALRQWRPNL